ncbi:MAG: hypothetical protein ACTSXP_03245 [Promethearchaeota archaeon]
MPAIQLNNSKLMQIDHFISRLTAFFLKTLNYFNLLFKKQDTLSGMVLKLGGFLFGIWTFRECNHYKLVALE